MARVVARHLVPVHRVTPNPDQVTREGAVSIWPIGLARRMRSAPSPSVVNG